MCACTCGCLFVDIIRANKSGRAIMVTRKIMYKEDKDIKKGWIIYALWQYNDGKKGDTNIQFTYSSQVLNRREKKPVAHKMFKGCLLVK